MASSRRYLRPKDVEASDAVVTRAVWNVKRVIASVVGLIILASLGYLWHSYRLNQLSDALLVRVDELEARGNYRAASDRLLEYIRLRSGSTSADKYRVRHALLFDRAAKDRELIVRSISRMKQALPLADDERRLELRHRLCERYLTFGRFEDAEQYAREGLEANADEPVFHRVLALSLVGQVREGELIGKHPPGTTVGGALQRAITLNPQNTTLPLQLALLYRRNRDLLDAQQRRQMQESGLTPEQHSDRIIDEMIQRNLDDGLAWLAKFNYQREFSKDVTDEDLKTAVKLSGDSLTVRLAAANYYLSQRDPAVRAEAVAHLRHVIDEIEPKSNEAWAGIVSYYADLGKFEEALEWVAKGSRKECLGADDFYLNIFAVFINTQLERYAEAEQALQKVDGLVSRYNLSENKAALIRLSRERDIARVVYLLDAGEKQRNGEQIQQGMKLAESFTQGGLNRTLEPLMRKIASVHERRGNFEQAALIYERMADLEGGLLLGQLSAARAWSKAGKPDLALRRMERLSREPTFNQRPDFWFELADMQFNLQLRQRQAARNWSELNTTLKKLDEFVAAGKVAQAWRVDMMKISRDVASLDMRSGAPELAQRIEELRQRLQRLQDKNLDEVPLLERASLIYEQLGDSKTSDELLKKLSALDPKADQVKRLEAQVLASRRDFAAAEKIMQELATVEKDDDEKRRILMQLADLVVRQGDSKRAREILREMVASKLADASVYYQLGQMAANEGDWKEVSECEKWLRRDEGEGGYSSQFLMVRRLLGLFPDIQAAESRELDRGLANLLKLRPDDPLVYSLKGLTQQARGELDAAVKSYRKAVDLGERNPVVFQRLVALLGENVAEGQYYLGLLSEPGATAELSGLQIQLAQRSGQSQQAIELARQEIKRRPDEFRSHLWLAQVIAGHVRTNPRVGEELRVEAEQEVRKAREMAPDNPEIWLANVAIALQLRGSDVARAMMAEADQFRKLAPSRQALLRAEAWVMLGERLDAEREYLSALKLDPGKPEYHLRVAQFYADFQVENAIQQARESLKIAPNFEPAKRFLAECLVRHGGLEQWNEAQKLTEDLSSSGDKLADMRQQVRLLIRRFGADNLRKARDLLVKMTAGEEVNPGDRFILAQIYEYERMVDDARRQFEALAKDKATSLSYIGGYVAFLLRQRNLEEADRQLIRLETEAPRSDGVLDLRVQWLVAKRELDKVDEVAQEYLSKNITEEMTDEVRARLQSRVGVILGNQKLYGLGEKYFRKSLELRPQNYVGLAECLAYLNRKGEAIDVCFQAAKADDSSRPVIALCTVLLVGDTKPEDFARCESLISQSLAKHPDDLPLVFSVANARFFEGRVEEATALYDRALKLNPRDVALLNNYAAMLGEIPERQSDALAKIDQAIDITGPHPNLLDTKAMILVNNGRAGEAIKLLEEAIRDLRPDPRFVFHLAIAYREIRQTKRARELFQRARKEEVLIGVLSNFERKAWDNLLKEYGEGEL